MKTYVWLILLVFLFTGCATHFQANWFFDHNGNDGGNIYLAVLNHSDETQTITKITLNPSGDKGWILKLGENGEQLGPGELFIKPVSAFGNDEPSGPFPAECWLPIRAEIYTTNYFSKEKIRLNGRLPSSIPDGWENKCLNADVVPS